MKRIYHIFFFLGLVAIIHPPLASPQQLEIHIIDVGQGASELVIGPDGTSILIDGGTSSKGTSEVIPYLNAIFPPGSRHLDYMIASHDDNDHYGGLNSVLSGGYTAGTIYHCGNNASFGKGVQIPLGLEIDLGDGARVTCVGRYGEFIDGSSGSTSDNNESICLLVEYCGFYGEYGGFDYITAGDLEGNENYLSNALITYPPGNPYLDPAYGVDVIHVNHHGSNYSSRVNYVNRLKPDLAVINGGTSYGHPRWRAVDRLKGRSVYSDGGGPTGVTWTGATQVYRTTYDIEEDGRAPEWDCPTLGDMVITYAGCSTNYYLNGNPFPVDDPCICATPTLTPVGYHTPSPTPSVSPTPSPTSTLTPPPSPTPTPEGYHTPTPSPSIPPTPSPTSTPTSTPTPPTAGFPFYDGFESGEFGQNWSIITENEGRALVSMEYPCTGTYSALIDDSNSNSTYSTAGLILTIDLSAQTDIDLAFQWREFNDENHAQDGVFISDDYGGAWSQLFSFNNGPSECTFALLDLSTAAASSGLSLNDHFQIKFQFYDNYSIPIDGYAIDDVRVWRLVTPTASPTPSPTPEGYQTPPPSPSPTAEYCSASGGCDEYISRVQFNPIDNSSGCDGYADFTALSTAIMREAAYGITVTNPNPYAGDECDLWVDWNRDKDFSDAGESATLSGGPDVFTGTITAPAGALLGETRLRIRLRYYQSLQPCGDFTYGDVEDYTVVVVPSVTPTPEGYQTPTPAPTPEGYQLVYSFPLDTDPGWTTESDWAFGQPEGNGSHSGDPTAGYTGSNVYGYNLSGDYPNDLSPMRYLTTNALDCSAVTGVSLRFSRWLGVESSIYDQAGIDMSTDGLTWLLIWEHSGYSISESAWSPQACSLSPSADRAPAVYLRWWMGTTNNSVTYPGWNIDDIEIWGTYATPTPSVTPTVAPTPSLTPTPSVTPTPSLPPTVPPTPSLSPTPRVTPTTSVSPTVTPIPSLTPAPSVSPTVTPIQSVTPAPTVSPTATPTPPPTVTPSLPPTPTPFPTPVYLVLSGGDYTGDGISDIAVFRQDNGLWSVRGLGATYFGKLFDIPSAGDYNGDGIADVAIFRPSTGLWAIKTLTRFYFGDSADLPVPGDYDGDGTCDAAVFHGAAGRWSVRGITRRYFGIAGDRPVPGDYDDDGTAEIAISRDTTGLWAVLGYTRCYYGRPGDLPIPGIYKWTGSFPCFPAIFRPSGGLWAIRATTRFYYGRQGDTPLVGDFTGDTLDNNGIFRGDIGLWAIRGITRVYYGRDGDSAVSR